MPSNTNVPYVGFRTNRVWTAGDVAVLASSVSGIYAVLLAYRVRARFEQRYSEALEGSLEKYGALYERYFFHPAYHDLFRLRRDALRDWRKRRGRYPLLPPFPFPVQLPQLEASLPEASDIHSKLHHYADEDERLRLYRIQMASPGSFGFTGIGEVIKELRELIKDIWFRNQQEKIRGQLEIIDKYLCMRREHQDQDLPHPSVLVADRQLVELIDEHVRKLKELEVSGKLLPVGEHLDYLPES